MSKQREVMEGDETISNTREYSGRNILERNGLFQSNMDQSGAKKREVVDRA